MKRDFELIKNCDYFYEVTLSKVNCICFKFKEREYRLTDVRMLFIYIDGGIRGLGGGHTYSRQFFEKGLLDFDKVTKILKELGIPVNE